MSSTKIQQPVYKVYEVSGRRGALAFVLHRGGHFRGVEVPDAAFPLTTCFVHFTAPLSTSGTTFCLDLRCFFSFRKDVIDNVLANHQLTFYLSPAITRTGPSSSTSRSSRPRR
jgi:hypothetical protein